MRWQIWTLLPLEVGLSPLLHLILTIFIGQAYNLQLSSKECNLSRFKNLMTTMEILKGWCHSKIFQELKHSRNMKMLILIGRKEILFHNSSKMACLYQTANYAETCLSTTTESPHQKIPNSINIRQILAHQESFPITPREILFFKVMIIAKWPKILPKLVASCSRITTSRPIWIKSGRPNFGSRWFSSSTCRNTPFRWVCRK